MLTDKQIKALEPKSDAYYETDDTSRRGYGRLAIKVSPSGSKAFYLIYRFDSKRKFLPLGIYPTLTLKKARSLADEHGQFVFDGKDPRDILEAIAKKEKEDRDNEYRKTLEGSVGQMFDLFIEKTKSERSHQYYIAVQRVLSSEILKTLGATTKANAVEPQHIAAALRPITSRGSLVMANRSRSYLSAAFAYGLQFDFSPARKETDPLFNLKYNPVTAVPKSLKAETPSDRALSEDELHTFWLLIENSQLILERKILLKLLVLFGGRRVSEVIAAPWSEFNLKEGLWNRPASRDKKGKHVLMPIGRMANELLSELHQYTGHQQYLFGDKPPTDYAINQTVRRLINKKMAHFTPKSLRATAKTLMGKIGITKEARDRYHSHALTDISSKHYDKYDYLDQHREVVRRWEAFMSDVINGVDHKPGLRGVA
jgi:integrase